MEAKNVVVRMPPSPTGHIHIGNVRTLIFNYLFAKQHSGRIVFRSEDTDKLRSTKEFESAMLEELEWLGLEWDEFYRQSERGDIYRNHLETLIEQGKAYISKEESEKNPGEMLEVVRFRNPNTTITFTDAVRGEISFDTTELKDFVIARSLTDAVYHFAVVVDDFLMGITHVIRGEDHISNTPRQILIQEAIGAPRPVYVHLPLILAPDRSKLSKRHGAVSLSEYRKEGFLPEAVINYLTLLGWNPGTEDELFTPAELIAQFDFHKIQKGGAIFDREKFIWFNREHIVRKSDAWILDALSDWLPETHRGADSRLLNRLIPLIRDRIKLLSDITKEAENGEFTFAFTPVDYATELLKWKKDASVKDALPRLEKAAEILESIAEYPTIEEVKAALMPYAEEVGKGEVLWPLRVALTGKERSPDPFSAIYVLGRDESIKRVRSACDRIKSA